VTLSTRRGSGVISTVPGLALIPVNQEEPDDQWPVVQVRNSRKSSSGGHMGVPVGHHDMTAVIKQVSAAANTKLACRMIRKRPM
jgi:hypothetical protein